MAHAALLAVAAAGAITNSVGAYAEQKSIQSTNELNASLTKANEKVRQASFALEVTKLEEQKEAFVGAQVAKIAKSGFRMTGSPLQVVEKSIANFNRDIIITKVNAAVSRASAQQTADIYQTQADFAGRMAFAKATQSLLSSGSEIGLSQYGGK